MSRRGGLQRVIWILVILDILLLAVFLVLHIADARIPSANNRVPASQISIPVVTDARAPEDASLSPGEAEQILNNGSTSGRAAQTTLSAAGEQLEADLVVGGFQQRGGPAFSLYVPSELFHLTENEGKCYVAAVGSAGVQLYLELAFLPNTDASSVAASLLKSYGAVSVENPARTEAFGGYSALQVTGSSAETDLEAYVVSVNGGCITAVLCVPGIEDDNAAALRAAFDTLMLDS